MKVAVLSESEADETAILVLVRALLGGNIERAAEPSLRSRGWPSVLDVLPSVYKHLHYRTDADGLVVVADANRSPLHREEGGACAAGGNCRLCLMSQALAEARGQVAAVPGRDPLNVAIGLAVPAIEAWYLCGTEVRTGEREWTEGIGRGSPPYTKLALKEAAYGSDRAPLPVMKQRGVEQADRLTGDLERLKRKFPVGFGGLADAVQAWV